MIAACHRHLRHAEPLTRLPHPHWRSQNWPHLVRSDTLHNHQPINDTKRPWRNTNPTHYHRAPTPPSSSHGAAHEAITTVVAKEEEGGAAPASEQPSHHTLTLAPLQQQHIPVLPPCVVGPRARHHTRQIHEAGLNSACATPPSQALASRQPDTRSLASDGLSPHLPS
ncbi:hypothetical protein ZWY2020_009978 [Hordeum vulgare]|nr:hypothetical protein ZWY2020_009978 [Hordeum vulgare]